LLPVLFASLYTDNRLDNRSRPEGRKKWLPVPPGSLLSATTYHWLRSGRLANKTHRTSVPAKSKSSDNRKRLSTVTVASKSQRSPAMTEKIIALGVPRALAADLPVDAASQPALVQEDQGKVRFFGSVADGWQKALQRFNEDKTAIFAGRKPERTKDGFRLARAEVPGRCSFGVSDKAVNGTGELPREMCQRNLQFWRGRAINRRPWAMAPYRPLTPCDAEMESASG
jgi:hypothetical protein